MSHPCCEQLAWGLQHSPPEWETMQEANVFLKAMKFNSSSFLMRLELLCFILGSHGESGESFRRLQEFNLQSHMRNTHSH